MGQAVSAAVKTLTAGEEENKADAIEELGNLQRMVKAKLEAESSKLDKAAFDDPRLPILAVVNRDEKYLLDVKSAPNADIQKCLNNVIGGEFLKGVQNVLSVALGELLGNTAAGEQEKRAFHVVFADNGLLRVDCYMYKYNFDLKGLKEKHESIFGYFIQVGVLDVMKVAPQILLYELTRSVGDSDKLKEARRELKEIATFTEELYDIVSSLQKSSGNRDLEQGPPLKKLKPSDDDQEKGEGEEKEQEQEQEQEQEEEEEEEKQATKRRGRRKARRAKV
ncbi:hypothetical protein ACROYT_G006364 [Oculina patagonica]